MVNSNNRPLILVTNDDGHKAGGLEKLIGLAAEFGDLVVISASESQSGRSHAITIKDPIKYKMVEEREGYTRYLVKGTPVDGVKLLLCSLLDRHPDLILSGINHGTNSSTSVVYSGTMAAAIEGAIHHIPSIGFSLLDYRPNADFDAAEAHIRHIIYKAINAGLPKGVCLNVNIPAVPEKELKGIKVCRQTNGYWEEQFQEREDPRGSKYAWLTGSFTNREPEAVDTDEWALKNNYISIVPVKTDLTAHEVIPRIRDWEEKRQTSEKERKI
ncbi:MAG: 5'/3'-nucleotidase SurE [Bacteroidales bacterium]|nr:5'/3'-nucleotidase SurE [Bacteroidales bacterium]